MMIMTTNMMGEQLHHLLFFFCVSVSTVKRLAVDGIGSNVVVVKMKS